MGTETDWDVGEVGNEDTKRIEIEIEMETDRHSDGVEFGMGMWKKLEMKIQMGH